MATKSRTVVQRRLKALTLAAIEETQTNQTNYGSLPLDFRARAESIAWTALGSE